VIILIGDNVGNMEKMAGKMWFFLTLWESEKKNVEFFVGAPAGRLCTVGVKMAHSSLNCICGSGFS
jgi:hypothetical protein